VAALIPLVVVLMAKRKVIVDLLRKKIKRVTNRCTRTHRTRTRTRTWTTLSLT
jgi:sorbitol-specific phosphotransferase system component IIC